MDSKFSVGNKVTIVGSCQNCKYFDTGIFEEPCVSCKWDRKDMREDAPILWEAKED